ncbi:hypothetical protein [Streptacidiphilus carbonis]|uniref:hypothetical protein n=1 Tax=Streptacidiphilus carbonis TaxID=105422 RepID=UPI0005A99FA8|nr:hypothetical protein [Streptacidiphilus carbonis]
MIAAVGHADLTADTLELVAAELVAAVERCEPSLALVPAGAGLPLVFGRAVHRAGLPLVLLLPTQRGVPALLDGRDRAAAGELIMLAGQVRLVPWDGADRGARISAEERLIASCRRVLAVWDGSPSDGADATAHLVAFALTSGVAVEVLWPAGAMRTPDPAAAGPLA